MWVARDKDGTLRLFIKVKPCRNCDCAENEHRWITDEDMTYECILEQYMFPELTWEDDPVEVNLHEYGKNNDNTYLRMCDQINHLWSMNKLLSDELTKKTENNITLMSRLNKVYKALNGELD